MVQNCKSSRNKWWWILLLSFIALCILGAYFADVCLLNEYSGRGANKKVDLDHVVIENALINSKVIKISDSGDKGYLVTVGKNTVNVNVWGLTEKELSDVRNFIKKTVQQENVGTDVILKVFEEGNVVRNNGGIKYNINYDSFKKSTTVEAP